MNKERRSELDRAKTMLEAAHAILEECASGERDYYDNMPESIQEGDKGIAADEASSELEDAANSVEEVIDAIEAVTAGGA